MDDADNAQERMEAQQEKAIAAASRAAKNIPVGKSGACSRCRDKYRLE